MAGGINVGSATARIIIEAGDALKSIKQVEEGLTSLRRSTLESSNVQGLGAGMAGFGAAVAAGFGLAINTAANFESAMSGVEASLGGVGGASGLTADQMSSLSEEALRIGSTTSKSASEAAQAMDLMAKAGVDATTILEGGAQAAVNLSEATGEGLAISAETTAAAFALFSDQGYSAGQIADFLTTTMNNSSASMAELQTGLSNLSPVIANTGMGLDEAGAALAFFNSRGVPAARVGTGLATAFRMVSAPTAEAAQAMQDLGINAFDAQGNFVGFPALFDQVQTATAGMTEQQRSAALALIFGAEAADVMAIAAKEGGDGIRDLTDDMNVSGSAAASAATRLDNFSGSLEQFKGAIETALIVIGTQLLPVARQVIDAATAMVEAFLALPSGVQTAIAALVGIAGALSLAGGGFILLAPRILNTVQAVRALATAFPVLGKAIAGLGAASPWILAIVAAIALLGLAYKTNFLGFADLVDGVVAKVRDFATSVSQMFKLISATGKYDTITAAFRSLGMVIEGVTGLGVTEFFTRMGRSLNRPLAAIRKMASAFGGIGEALLDGDWDKALRQFGKALAGLGDAVSAPAKAAGDFFKSIHTGIQPLDRLLRDLGNTFTDFGRIIQEVMSGDFGGAFDVAQRMLERFGRMGQTAFDGIRDAIAAIDWGSVWGAISRGAQSAINAVSNLVGSVVDWALDIGVPAVTGWVTEQAGNLWDWLTEQYPGLLDLAGDIASWTFNIALPTLGGALSTGFTTTWTWVKGQIPGITTLIGEIGSWLFNVGMPTLAGALNTEFSTVWTWLKGQIPGITTLVGEIGSWLFNVGMPTLAGALSTGFTTVWTWIKGQIPGITSLAGEIASWTFSIGLPMLGGAIKTGFTTTWEWLKSQLPGLGSLAGSFGSWTIFVGIPSIGGAIVNAFTTVWDWLKSVVSWLGGSDTISHTVDSVDIDVPVPTISGGIVDAFDSMWSAAKSVASWLTDSFTRTVTGDITIDGTFKAVAGLAEKFLNAVATAFGWVREAGQFVYDAVVSVKTEITDGGEPPDTKITYPEPMGGDFGFGDNQQFGGNTARPPQGGGPGTNSLGRMVLPAPDTSAVDAAIEGVKSKLSGLTKTQSKARIDGDNSGFISALSIATKAANAWNTVKVTAKLAGDNGLFISELQRAIKMAVAWAAATFTSTLAANADAAMQAAAACFDIGRAWAGETFSARFTADISPLEAVVGRVREIAGEIRALLPSSPAERGPLSKPVSFGYIADALASAMEQMGPLAHGGVAAARRALDQQLALDMLNRQHQQMMAAHALTRMPLSGYAANAGPVYNDNRVFLAVKSEEFVRLQQQAEQGASFANEFDWEVDVD